MELGTLNQNTNNLKFNLSSFMTKTLGQNFGNNNSGTYYSKKGDPFYQKGMDADDDGVVSFDEFRNYCKDNNISTNDMKKMLEVRLKYLMSQNDNKSESENNSDKKTISAKEILGSLDLIYAKDGDNNYDSDIDVNKDSKISYTEYLRYCEQNAKTEVKNSDTKIVDYDKNKFMTVSFGHASNAYTRAESDAPEGKVEGRA